VFDCKKNFRPGQELQDGNLVKIKLGLGEAKREIERWFDRAGERRYSEPITVAHAIREDFRAYFPSEEIQPPPNTTSPS